MKKLLADENYSFCLFGVVLLIINYLLSFFLFDNAKLPTNQYIGFK